MRGRITGIAVAMVGMAMSAGALRVWAQSGTSSALAGSVEDKSGAAVANARVKAAEVNTGALRAVESNADGRFLFSQVNPGTYRIEVDATGFGVGRSQPVSVAVGQTASVNFCAFACGRSLRLRNRNAICFAQDDVFFGGGEE